MEKIWLKNYPKGTPAEIDPDQYTSLVQLFKESCTQFASDPAYYSFGVTLRYQQLQAYSQQFAAFLQNTLQLKKGDRVGLMLPNILQYPIALFGVLSAGGVVVNINPLYTAPELVYQMNDAQADVLVTLDHFAETLQKALPNMNVKHVIVAEVSDFFAWPKMILSRYYLKYVKKWIPKITFDYISFKNALKLGRRSAFQDVILSPQDLAFLQYTGGTTGVAKGAMLTHRNIVANILQTEAWFSSVLSDQSEIIITALPLYHIFSLTANCLFMVKIGANNILIANPRHISSVIAEMKKFKFTLVTGVNTLFNALLNHPAFVTLEFSQVKISLGGGMAVQRVVAEKWQKVTGKTLLEGYGLTETSPCVCINPPNLAAYNGSIGLPVSSTDICILDPEGREVPIGEHGELAVKGPQVMLGYWNNPEETRKVFTQEGWLLTGDICSINNEGYVTLLERKKDMILVSGFNVYPNEVEDVLAQIPGVREAAVIGILNGSSGEAVKAFIVRSDPNLTEQAIRDFCRANLTGYKIPRYIEFREELPKSTVGKILRRALK